MRHGFHTFWRGKNLIGFGVQKAMTGIPCRNSVTAHSLSDSVSAQIKTLPTLSLNSPRASSRILKCRNYFPSLACAPLHGAFRVGDGQGGLRWFCLSTLRVPIVRLSNTARTVRNILNRADEAVVWSDLNCSLWGPQGTPSRFRGSNNADGVRKGFGNEGTEHPPHAKF